MRVFFRFSPLDFSYIRVRFSPFPKQTQPKENEQRQQQQLPLTSDMRVAISLFYYILLKCRE